MRCAVRGSRFVNGIVVVHVRTNERTVCVAMCAVCVCVLCVCMAYTFIHTHPTSIHPYSQINAIYKTSCINQTTRSREHAQSSGLSAQHAHAHTRTRSGKQQAACVHITPTHTRAPTNTLAAESRARARAHPRILLNGILMYLAPFEAVGCVCVCIRTHTHTLE